MDLHPASPTGSVLSTARGRVLKLGRVSGYGSPTANQPPGLALIHLQRVNYTPLHRTLHGMHGSKDLHGNVVAYRWWRTALSHRQVLDGRRWLGLIPQHL
jgi:hypothetical protein